MRLGGRFRLLLMSDIEVSINQVGDGRYEWRVVIDGWGDTSSVAASEAEASVAMNDWIVRWGAAQPLAEPVVVQAPELVSVDDAMAAIAAAEAAAAEPVVADESE